MSPRGALSTTTDGPGRVHEGPATRAEGFLEKSWGAPLLLLVLALVIFLAYCQTIHGPFQLDDEVWIVKNPAIKNLSNLPSILLAQRGLTTASLALNYAMGGLDPRGYHLVNIFIHIINAVLVYLFVAQTLGLAGLAKARARLLGISAAAVFSLHPVQTEAVSYIVQRMESMSALFSLLALLAFARGAAAALSTKRYACYALATAAYVAAFYSKEIAITVPGLILLYDICFVAQGSVRALIGRWPLYAVLGGLSLFFVINTVAPLGGFNDVSSQSQRETAPSAAPAPTGEYADLPALKQLPTAGFGVTSITPYQYFLTESNVLLYYYTLLIFPARQNIDYDFPVSRGLFERPHPRPGTRLLIPLPPPIVSLALHAALLVLAAFLFVRSLRRTAPRARCFSFFIIWFYLVLAPTSSFVPIVDVIFEHRLYLASLAYAVMLAFLVEKVLLGTADRAGAISSSKKH